MTQTWSGTLKNASITLSGDLLTATMPNSNFRAVYATEFLTSSGGLKYIEFSFTTLASVNAQLGLGNASADLTDGAYIGDTANSIGVLSNSGGQIWSNGLSGTFCQNASSVALTWIVGNRMAMAISYTNGKFWLNNLTTASGWCGESGGTQDPASNTGGTSIPAGVTGAAYGPGCGAGNVNSGNDVCVIYAASSSWTGTPPSGYGPFDTAGIQIWLFTTT